MKRPREERREGARCTACSFVNPLDMKFCGQCGAALRPAGTRPWAEQGERRQLTVLFCDLVDSTKLADLLDVEDLRELIREYQGVCFAVVERFRGHVAQYLGDGVLVYFGYPTAQEDSARRAVCAGVEMAEAVAVLGKRMERERGLGLAARIGIHTGAVVTGEVGAGPSREHLAVGSTPNIAARLQALAEPGSVVLSGTTHRIVRDFFRFRPLGPQTLKGAPRPVEVFQALGESGAGDRFESAIRRGLGPMFGRERELDLLLRCFEGAKEGRGQLVQVQGEAGLGKSRLVRQLARELTGRPHGWWSCEGSAYHQSSAFYPLIDLVFRLIGSSVGDAPETIRRRIEESHSRLGLLPAEAVPALCGLLSSSPGEGHSAAALSPPQVKERILETLLAMVLNEAASRPLVFVVEDLHWIDPSTREFLERLSSFLAGVRILLITTFRPELAPPWPDGDGFHVLRLARMGEDEAARIARSVAGTRTLPPTVLRQILETTGGSPLFVEELTKAVLESGPLDDAGPLPSLPIPLTLQDSLMSRLDRLGTAKEMAQLAAVLGRSFSLELLAEVSPWGRETAEKLLAPLVAAELLVALGDPPAVFSFRHPLIQEAAYASMLNKPRRALHARIAEVLEERFSAVAESQPELVAHHYTQAGATRQAISAWQRAAFKAAMRSANVETARHLETALGLLSSLPEEAERDRLELSLRTALGPPMTALQGFSAPGVVKIYDRAYELCGRLGKTPQLFPTLLGLCRFHTMGGSLETARQIADDLMAQARELNEVEKLVEAHRSLGGVLFFLGDLATARELCVAGIAIERRRLGSSRAPEAVYQPVLGCRAFGSWSLWLLGFADQALAMSREGLDIARRLGQPYDLTLALSGASLVHLLRREGLEARQLAAEQIELASEHRLSVPLASAKLLYGGSLVQEGQVEEGLDWLREGDASWRAVGAVSNLPFHSGYLLAQAYGRMGDPETGLALVEESLAIVEGRGERFFEPGLYLVKAELLAMRRPGDESAIEGLLQQALSTARRQRSQALELRAAMALGPRWVRAGRQEAAHGMLCELLGRLPEGHGTADLREAALLLEALGGGRPERPLEAADGSASQGRL